MLRCPKLIELNAQIRGFPRASSHPKIVNGLHAFPKQDRDYGVFFPFYTAACATTRGAFAPGMNSFTLEIRAKYIHVINRTGFHGFGAPDFPYPGNTYNGVGLCNYVNVFFYRVRDRLLGEYTIPIVNPYELATHTLVRSNELRQLRYYYNGELVTVVNNFDVNFNINEHIIYIYESGLNIGYNGYFGVVSFFRFSFLERSDEWIRRNFNNKYALDGNDKFLYNFYNLQDRAVNLPDQRFNMTITNAPIVLI